MTLEEKLKEVTSGKPFRRFPPEGQSAPPKGVPSLGRIVLCGWEPGGETMVGTVTHVNEDGSLNIFALSKECAIHVMLRAQYAYEEHTELRRWWWPPRVEPVKP